MMEPTMEQSDEEMAEMVARFRTPPGMNWEPLRDDIVTLLKSRAAMIEAKHGNAVRAALN
jgi:hypothetical protein